MVPGEALTAVLPVGGRGGRLGLQNRQKCLCNLDGQPLLLWMLRELQAAGIRQAVLLSGHFQDQIEAALPIMRTTLNVETIYGGTDGDAAAILKARDLLGTTFLVAGGDTIIPAQTIRELIELFFLEPPPLAACLASSYFRAAPEHYRVQASSRGELIRFLPADRLEAQGRPTNTGMHIMSAAIFEHLTGLPEKSSPEAALEIGLQLGKRVRVHVSELPWFALHRVEDFEHWKSLASAFVDSRPGFRCERG